MDIDLTPGALAALTEQGSEEVTLKVTELERKSTGKWACVLVDGSGQRVSAMFMSQVAKAFENGKLTVKDEAIIRLQNYMVNMVQGKQLVAISGMQVLQQGSGKAPSAAAAASDAAGSKADQQATPTAAKQQPPPSTPAARQGQTTPEAPTAVAARGAAVLTPGPTPSPSEQHKGTPSATPGPTVGRQPAFTPAASRPAASPIAVTERAGVSPIAALNPYQKNWVIKAKVMRKGLLRTFNRGGGETRLFDVELADAMGTQIQGSFWRESVDKFYDSLQEGKVYYFSNFSVKPANRQYATVRNDYQINFDSRTEVEEAADQGGISADAQVDLVPIDRLVKHVGRKAPVDVMGVVAAVGNAGTVKRKANNEELWRRDVTLADSSRRSVVVTLWGDTATRTDLDAAVGRVMQVTSVRVGDFNGCSLSSLMRSKVEIGPEGQEAAELQAWWDTEGQTADIQPVGQAAAGNGGGPRQDKLELLSAVQPVDIPPPDAKPTYHSVDVTVTQLGDRLTYTANPSNGKKVVPQDGRYWCEGDGCFVDAPEQRFMMSVKLSDTTGEVYASVFNDQGQHLMGCTAAEAAEVQESGGQALQSLASSVQWTEWTMVLRANSREYNGERRMRYTVHRLAPLDYAKEGQRLLQLIQQH